MHTQKVSVAELSRRTGINRTSLTHYKAGALPSEQHREAIVKALQQENPSLTEERLWPQTKAVAA